MLFVKMNGLGNDYVYIDSLKNGKDELEYLELNALSLVPGLCDRHFGIGADGVVILYPSDEADVRMKMFNADGSEGLTCGNALRCIGKYLSASDPLRERFLVKTAAGIAELKMCDGTVTVKLGIPEYVGRDKNVTFVNVGNPHAVIESDSLSDETFRKAAELSAEKDVNAELVLPLDAHSFSMRVCERGSGETLACGSGAAAAAYAMYRAGKASFPITVKLKGGTLMVGIDASDAVTITGDAETNYTGEVDIYRYGETER